MNKHTEYAFPWEPVYGNFVYCMPECKEKLMIYILEEDEQEASAIYVVRKNGLNLKYPQGYGESFYAVQHRIFTTDKEK